MVNGVFKKQFDLLSLSTYCNMSGMVKVADINFPKQNEEQPLVSDYLRQVTFSDCEFAADGIKALKNGEICEISKN